MKKTKATKKKKKTKTKPQLSSDPQYVDSDSWYYEKRNGLQTSSTVGLDEDCAFFVIPWRLIRKSLARKDAVLDYEKESKKA